MAAKRSHKTDADDEYIYEVYQSFMTGYVNRINDSTLRVPITGVRIGSAKYSRLAQINLDSGIITFSRYAIENVPERGRRYLVLHELAHVRERGHNRRFWSLVGQHEPDYKRIGRELEQAFHRNVMEDQIRKKKLKQRQSVSLPLIRTLSGPEFQEGAIEISGIATKDPGLLYPHDSGLVFSEDDNWGDAVVGIVCGGSDDNGVADVDYFDHLF